MTELRDARLRKAMDEAPDAALVPPPKTRDAIRAAAHAAVQPRWRRWLAADQGHRTPWAAAFATVLLASFITVMWQGQEIPGAEPEPAAPASPGPAAAPATPTVAAPTASAPTAAAPAAAAPRSETVQPAPQPREVTPPTAAAPEAARAPAPRPEAERRSVAPAAPAPVPAAPPLAADATSARPEAPPAAAVLPMPAPAPAAPLEKSNSTATAESAPMRDAAPLARPAPPPPPAPAVPPPAAPAPAARPATAAPVAPAPAPPAATAAPRAAAPALGLQLLPVPGNWTQVRVEAGADSIVLERSQAGDLSRLLEQVLRSPAQPLAPAAPVGLRFELAQGSDPLGVLELAGERWRWLPLRDVQQARSVRVDAALDAALREEAQRVLRR